ncbi:hypothetical protein T492DRAFT_875405 [Pavlovales sp. CCMP2436]|nr:hypothetical protein T492DRAFT_875405 [Pavlovales sp. CCMP2436]
MDSQEQALGADSQEQTLGADSQGQSLEADYQGQSLVLLPGLHAGLVELVLTAAGELGCLPFAILLL